MKEIIKVLKYKDLIAEQFGVFDINIEIRRRPVGHEKYNGFHRNKQKLIVIYHSKDMIGTLLHELTHAYQHRYMPGILDDNMFYKDSTDNKYWNRPVEKHARKVASIIGTYLKKHGISAIEDIDIADTMNLALDLI